MASLIDEREKVLDTASLWRRSPATTRGRYAGRVENSELRRGKNQSRHTRHNGVVYFSQLGPVLHYPIASTLAVVEHVIARHQHPTQAQKPPASIRQATTKPDRLFKSSMSCRVTPSDLGRVIGKVHTPWRAPMRRARCPHHRGCLGNPTRWTSNANPSSHQPSNLDKISIKYEGGVSVCVHHRA